MLRIVILSIEMSYTELTSLTKNFCVKLSIGTEISATNLENRDFILSIEMSYTERTSLINAKSEEARLKTRTCFSE